MVAVGKKNVTGTMGTLNATDVLVATDTMGALNATEVPVATGSTNAAGMMSAMGWTAARYMDYNCCFQLLRRHRSHPHCYLKRY